MKKKLLLVLSLLFLLSFSTFAGFEKDADRALRKTKRVLSGFGAIQLSKVAKKHHANEFRVTVESYERMPWKLILLLEMVALEKRLGMPYMLELDKRSRVHVRVPKTSSDVFMNYKKTVYGGRAHRYLLKKRITDAYKMKLRLRGGTGNGDFLNYARYNKRSKFFRFEVFDLNAEIIGSELMIIGVPAEKGSFRALVIRVDYTLS